MLANLLRRLAGTDAGAPLPAEDERIAVAALLVSAAHADGHYDAAEQAMIEAVLAQRYGLAPEAARAVRADGEAAEAAASDIYRFTALIKQAVPHEARAAVLEALWRVALADGTHADEEDHLMRRITGLLGLDQRDSIEARQRVRQGR